ncbi:MAG: hypothetical protein JSW05_04445, partial [Candidatus Thorarchaeota archaeon]
IAMPHKAIRGAKYPTKAPLGMFLTFSRSDIIAVCELRYIDAYVPVSLRLRNLQTNKISS